jgi:hypothetical protein
MKYPVRDGKLDIVREEVITPKKGSVDKPDFFRQPAILDFYCEIGWFVDVWGDVRKVHFSYQITAEGRYSDIRVKGQQSGKQRKLDISDNSVEACRIRTIWNLMGI